MITIYKITNRLNRKPYVRQTKQPIERRFIQHSKADSPLGNAMRDCGLDNFTIEVIEECATQEEANDRERFWIKVLNSKTPNGYNRSNGGEGGQYILSATNKRQFTMRMQPENYDKIKVIAALNKRSIAAQIEYLLEQCINGYEAEHGAIVFSPISKGRGVVQNNSGGTNFLAMGDTNYNALAQ